MNRHGSEDFTGLTKYQDKFQPAARRFDMGEKSNPAQLMGASAALRQILEWGIDNIAQTLATKTECIAQNIAGDKIQPVAKSCRAPHYLGLRFQGGLPAGLSESLAQESIYVSVRGPLMRVTPHLYTDQRDIDRFVSFLDDF
jgi:selenocysteine lyase/cysteine desulfurase